ncbi:MAG TPA: amino acid adenylation domain-containing protein [Chitinolyticbacter sp.]|nr:amino acid adenylation domain-containing protein [Chitinolyticbacter sp.]
MTHPVDTLPNFYAVLRHWAAECPDRIAFHFMPEGEAIEGELSFAELDLRARALAALLQANGWGETPLLLLYRPGLDFIVAFFACLYAGAIAVPAYPPTSNRSKSSRLRALVASCGARAVLTDATTRPDLDLGDLTAGLPVVCTDGIDTAAAADWRNPDADGSRVAFLQYSSGSTGDPKGVIVTHGNLLHNQQTIREAMGNGAHTVFASWLPVYHDMGLVGNVMQPLYLGVSCYLMPPMAFMQQPRRWLEVISRYRVTCTGGPNFAYDLCVDRIPEHERAGLDLRSWDVAYNGAEPVRAETLQRFGEAYRARGLRAAALYPCYGLAEGTLLVSGPAAGSGLRALAVDGPALASGRVEPAADPTGPKTQQLASCGRIWGGQTVRIVDPATLTPCEPGQVGEIWLQGPSISTGYWQRPDANTAIFAQLRDRPQDGLHCRTGDLGVFVDGELYVTGRLKEVLIVRGRNHYPQDIEHTVQSAWPGFVRGGGAAFMDGDRLVLVQEIARTALRTFEHAAQERVAREAVARHHGLALAELVAIKPATLSKTSSGKIRRGATRDSYLAGELMRIDAMTQHRPQAPTAPQSPPATQPTSPALALLHDALASIGVPAVAIEPQATLWQIGLDSLQIVDLQARLARQLTPAPSLDLLFSGATLAFLAGALEGLAQGAPSASCPSEAPPEPAGREAMLTPYQAAIWLRQQQTSAPIYNLAVALEFDGPVTANRIEQAYAGLVSRHRHLGQCVQVGDAGSLRWRELAAPVITRIATDGWSEHRLNAALRDFRAASFALESAPPLRACLFERESHGPMLALCIHHIATDFAGATNLVSELLTDLSGAAPRQAGNDSTALWHLQQLAAASEAPQEAWLARVAAAPSELDLGVALPRAEEAEPAGLAQYFGDLDADLTRACREAAAHSGGTLNIFLAAAFATLLHRYSGQASFCMGMPFSVRPRALSDWPGNAVNMVPITFEFDTQDRLPDLLARTRRGVAQGLQHRHLPLTSVADAVRRHQPARSRIFDVVFICQTEAPENARVPAELLAGCESWCEMPGISGLRVRSRRIAATASQALLTLLVFPDRHGGARLSLEFDRERVPQAFASRMLDHFEGLLRAAVREPSTPLDELAYLPETELHQQWCRWNAAGWARHRGSAAPRSLVQLFLEQARARPAHPAVVDAHGGALSYAELELRARGVRSALQEQGVTLGDCVGVALPRDAMLPAAILGVLMCGAAYVPLDLDYPAERLRYILETSGARHVLTESGHAEEFESAGAQCLLLGESTKRIDATPGTAAAITPDDLAYVLFTSGSTGQPKGVQVTHGNVVALLDWARDTFTEAERARVLASTSICFDLSVFEFFVPLCLGTTCVVVPRVLDLIDQPRLGVTMINSVPSAIEALLASGAVPPTVTTALVAGEPFRQALVERLYRDSGVRRVLDLYGPTEDTVYSTVAERRPAGHETIGYPLPGTRAYVLDAAQQPVPVGLPGELYLAGSGLSRGYRGREDLTRAAFSLPAGLAHLESRVYRTGDIVRLAEDGEIIYLGRRDHQVKIRGYRIELQEIDACLASSPWVRESVANVLTSAQGQPVLVAYVAWRADVEHGTTPRDALEAHLARHLPHYMRPQHIVTLDNLPRTLNGKIDRRSLPQTLAEPAPSAGDEPPLEGLESELAQVWTDVLGMSPPGRSANFIELGGNSLSAVQLRAALQHRLSLNVPLSVLLTMPVLSQQAEVLGELRAAASVAALDDDAELEEMSL